MRRLLFTTAASAVGLQRQPGAGLHHGHHRHGPFIDAGDDRDPPRSTARARSRRSASRALPTRRLAPVPLASDPTTPGTVVTCSTPTGQIGPATRRCRLRPSRSWQPRSRRLPLGMGTPTVPPRFDATAANSTVPFALSAQPATSFLSIFPARPCRLRRWPQPRRCRRLPLPRPQRRHRWHRPRSRRPRRARRTMSTTPSSTAMMSHARDHSHAGRRQHDRNHFAGAAARQPFDHRMQFDAGRPADQRRGFAAVDAANSGQPAARHDRARGTRASPAPASIPHTWRCADAEYVGLRRERDDESGDARHDGAGQCHRRPRNARRIAAYGPGR